MQKKRVMWASLLVSLTLGCSGSSGFGGSSGSAPTGGPATSVASGSAAASGASQTAAPADNATNSTAVAVADSGIPTPPSTAIKSGSFTVWTDPADPAANQDYHVYVEVALPSGLSNYTISDLTGNLVGTDDYTQVLGADAGSHNHQTFTYSGSTALLVASVPGGAQGVTDTVTMHSAVLSESDSIALTFSGGSGGDGDGDGDGDSGGGGHGGSGGGGGNNNQNEGPD